MKYAIAILLLLWGSSALFVLDAREVAVVTQFGETTQSLQKPGLYVKAPWPIQIVRRFEGRTQLLEMEPFEAFTKDTKNLVLTPFALWKISDPKVFLERVRNAENAASPIRDVVTSHIAASIGKLPFSEVLTVESKQTSLLPSDVLKNIDKETQRFGISIQEIRIQQLNLPVQNEQSIYERMRAERSRIANRYRSEGEEQADAIRAKADRESVEIRTEAEKKAAEIRANAERQASVLYAEAYRQNPELYKLLRDLESVQATMENGGNIVLPLEKRPFSTLISEPR